MHLRFQAHHPLSRFGSIGGYQGTRYHGDMVHLTDLHSLYKGNAKNMHAMILQPGVLANTFWIPVSFCPFCSYAFSYRYFCTFWYQFHSAFWSLFPGFLFLVQISHTAFLSLWSKFAQVPYYMSMSHILSQRSITHVVQFSMPASAFCKHCILKSQQPLPRPNIKKRREYSSCLIRHIC